MLDMSCFQNVPIFPYIIAIDEVLLGMIRFYFCRTICMCMESKNRARIGRFYFGALKFIVSLTFEEKYYNWLYKCQEKTRKYRLFYMVERPCRFFTDLKSVYINIFPSSWGNSLLKLPVRSFLRTWQTTKGVSISLDWKLSSVGIYESLRSKFY